MTDPISDMLTQIRNAISAKKTEVALPYSKFKHSLADLLSKNGRLEKVEVTENDNRKILKLSLKYESQSGAPVIFGLKRISKPGQRIYTKGQKVPRVRVSANGMTIVSTSKGLMTDEQARKQNVGGEIVCQIW